MKAAVQTHQRWACRPSGVRTARCQAGCCMLPSPATPRRPHDHMPHALYVTCGALVQPCSTFVPCTLASHRTLQCTGARTSWFLFRVSSSPTPQMRPVGIQKDWYEALAGLCGVCLGRPAAGHPSACLLAAALLRHNLPVGGIRASASHPDTLAV